MHYLAFQYGCRTLKVHRNIDKTSSGWNTLTGTFSSTDFVQLAFCPTV